MKIIKQELQFEESVKQRIKFIGGLKLNEEKKITK